MASHVSRIENQKDIMHRSESSPGWRESRWMMTALLSMPEGQDKSRLKAG
jgi:hypothetical protein